MAAAKPGLLARRRPVARHPGVYYRPRASGKVGPPYEIAYLDATGKRRWQVIHGSLEEAEARRAELRLRRRRGERIQPSRQSFAEHVPGWLERQNVRPRTLEVYRWALNQHLLPYFGRRRLDQISCEDIAAFISLMRHKGLKGSTTSTALRPLSMILAQAARKGQIPHNPISLLERGERPRHDDQRPKRILSLDEMHALLRHTDSPLMRCLFELILTSGVRIGEALGLTAADLDTANAVIRIEHQLGRDGTRTPLKTDASQRAIDIPPRLTRRLRAHLIQRDSLTDPQAFLFASRTGAGFERKVVRAALARASRSAQLASPAPTLHDLRHSHASMLIALDYNVVDVQHRLGHRSPDTTLRVYAHQWKYREAQKSRIGADIGQLFSQNQHKQLRRSAHPTPLALPPAPAANKQSS